jgi:hypothetical protein
MSIFETDRKKKDFLYLIEKQEEAKKEFDSFPEEERKVLTNLVKKDIKTKGEGPFGYYMKYLGGFATKEEIKEARKLEKLMKHFKYKASVLAKVLALKATISLVSKGADIDEVMDLLFTEGHIDLDELEKKSQHVQRNIKSKGSNKNIN